MDMNSVLWIVQVLLAAAFLGAGASHVVGYERAITRPRMEWMQAVGRDNMRIIGILEILGAIGLVVPAATGILPWLTPLAAALLAVVMVLAAIFHLRRSGEVPNAVINLVLGLLALFVAYGRFVLEPIG